jgi:ribosomal protein L40E
MDYAPMAAAHQNDGVDARGAAAVRLSAVTVGQQPVDPAQPALFDIPIAAQSNPPAPTAPARPEADQDVIEATKRQPAQTKRSQTRDVSASGPAPVPAPAAQPAPVAAEPLPASPWPPLGASWPAQADPNAPWPGPDTNLVPAVVAAQAAPAPVLTDMWLQSSQEVLNRGAVRVCHRCALPVSTQARFCRRCGTRQI